MRTSYYCWPRPRPGTHARISMVGLGNRVLKALQVTTIRSNVQPRLRAIALEFVNIIKDSKSVTACRETLYTKFQDRSSHWQGGLGRGEQRSGAFNCIHYVFCPRPDAGDVGVLVY